MSQIKRESLFTLEYNYRSFPYRMSDQSCITNFLSNDNWLLKITQDEERKKLSEFLNVHVHTYYIIFKRKHKFIILVGILKPIICNLFIYTLDFQLGSNLSRNFSLFSSILLCEPTLFIVSSSSSLRETGLTVCE